MVRDGLSDLVDMMTNLVDWSTFATEIEVFQRLHEDFEDVNLSHIPQNKKWSDGRINKRSED